MSPFTITMLKRKPIPLDFDTSTCNNHNLHEYDPYMIFDGNLVIDEDWWNSLTDYIKDLIKMKLSDKFQLGKIIVPHVFQPETPEKFLTTVYQSYLDGFDYNVWYHPDIPNGPQNVKLIRIPTETKKSLINENFSELVNLQDDIRKQMLPDTPYFVRLSSTSGKNEQPIKPFVDPYSIIEHLVSVNLFSEQEYKRDKESYIILIPWNETINPRHEFRIFVVNRKLTAASPQRYWELHQHSQEELEAFEEALNNLTFLDLQLQHLVLPTTI